MNSTRTSLARIISTGFVVSLIFGICLFWMNAVLRKIGKEELVGRQGMSLPLDLGDKKLSDPNVVVRGPRVLCDMRFVEESDIFLDFLLREPMWIIGYQQGPYSWQFDWDLASDMTQAKCHIKQGLIVAEDVQTDLEGDSPTPRIRYVGPKGFGESPDRALGRFSDPQLSCKENPSTLFVYDRDLMRYFRIDFALGKVTSESWADKSIIATNRAYLAKFGGLLRMHADGAFRWETDAEMEARLEKERKPLLMFSGDDALEIDPRMTTGEIEPKDLEEQDYRQSVSFGPRVHGGGRNSDPWAMDDQGTVYLVDRETLLLSPPKGRLPRCGTEKTHLPSQLLAYTALPLFVDQQYLGLVAASLSRDGSEFVMVFVDPQGREKGRTFSNLRPQSYQYGRVTSSARTVLDFAQPLVFSVASSLWAPRTEAIAGYRSLFVLPMSMPARIASDKTMKVGDRVGTVVMLNVFTWIVGLFLAIAVIRDLKQLGMSNKTQKAWLFACMGFGWIAVITYLLTRPRPQFVTCTGCGSTRRIDQALCLHCEADWAMRDLQVPGWRVVD